MIAVMRGAYNYYLSRRLIVLAAKSRTSQCGTNMWIALNNIHSIEVGDETIVSVHAHIDNRLPYTSLAYTCAPRHEGTHNATCSNVTPPHTHTHR